MAQDARAEGSGRTVGRSTLESLLGELGFPEVPVDGDCLVWTPRVVESIRGAGYEAEATDVVGWHVGRSKTIVFIHRAALTENGLIVDVTARQYDLRLPSLWIDSLVQYCTTLAGSTGVDEVTVGRWH